MRSPHGSFGEEGEIFDSDVEKAPPSLPSVSGPSVDRHSSRIQRPTPVSPSRSPPSRYPNADRYSDRRRLDHPPRGEKRRRSREDDERSHRVHYEASRASKSTSDMPIRRPRVSYADIDRSEAARNSNNNNKNNNNDSPDRYNASKRPRSRSRSPQRASAGRRAGGGGSGGAAGNTGRDYYDDRSNRYDPRDSRGSNGACRYSGRSRSKDRFATTNESRGDDPHRYDRGRRDAEARSKDSDRHPDRRNERYVALLHLVRPFTDDGVCRDDKPSKPFEPTLEIEDPVDEAKIIEERRKKREAIKAKYRGQATPLLATALGVRDKDTPATSPGDSSDINSPRMPTASPGESPASNMASQATPRSPRDMTPASVFTLAKEGTAVPDEAVDEPSAADYDPTADMQEDQKRNEQRLHKNEVSSGAYNEMTSTDRDVLMREVDVAPVESDAQPEKTDGDDDFDMFAEGEDDDMFASPAPATNTAGGAAPTKAVPIIEAKQLDASLLDNWDDQEGYYKMIPGELLDGRYKVQMSLGKGMFSGVVRALDMTTNKDSAIKIIRNNETM